MEPRFGNILAKPEHTKMPCTNFLSLYGLELNTTRLAREVASALSEQEVRKILNLPHPYEVLLRDLFKTLTGKESKFNSGLMHNDQPVMKNTEDYNSFRNAMQLPIEAAIEFRREQLLAIQDAEAAAARDLDVTGVND
jgi:hypothetical protein